MDTKQKQLSRDLLAFLLIAALILLHFYANIHWLKNNPKIAGPDAPQHLLNTLTMTTHLKQAILNKSLGDFFFQLNSQAIVTNSTWPRLFYFVAAIFNMLFGISFFTSIMSNLFWFLILLVSVYLIGRRLLFNQQVGLLAILFTGFSPFLWGMSRLYGLDFPLAAVSALSIYLFIISDDLRHSIYTILFFSVLGIGTLIKVQIVLFFAPLLLWVLVKQKWKDIWLNFGLGLIVFTLISSLFWSGNLEEIFKNFFALQQRAYDSALPKDTNLKESLLYYWHYLLKGTGILIILSLVGIYRIIIRRDKSVLLIYWVFLPLILFSLINPKHEQYLLPTLAAIYLIAAIGIFLWENKHITFWLVTISLGIYIVVFLTVTFNKSPVGRLKNLLGAYEKIHFKEYYNLDEVGAECAAAIQKEREKNKIDTIAAIEHLPLNKDRFLILLYYIRQVLPESFAKEGEDLFLSTKFTNRDFFNHLSSIDCLLVITQEKDDTINYNSILNANFKEVQILGRQNIKNCISQLSRFKTIGQKEVVIDNKKCFLNILVRGPYRVRH